MQNRGYIVFFAVILFYLNDFFFIAFQNDYLKVIGTDYGTRIISLIILFLFGVRYHHLSNKSDSFYQVAVISSVFIIVGIIQYFLLSSFIGELIPDSSLFSFPAYPSKFMKIIDLSLGLILVAVSEEIIFRGVVIGWLQQKCKNNILIVLVSTSVFSLMHWCGGEILLINTFVWGLFPAIYYVKTKKLLPCIIGHYITNFLIYINN